MCPEPPFLLSQKARGGANWEWFAGAFCEFGFPFCNLSQNGALTNAKRGAFGASAIRRKSSDSLLTGSVNG